MTLGGLLKEVYPIPVRLALCRMSLESAVSILLLIFRDMLYFCIYFCADFPFIIGLCDNFHYLWVTTCNGNFIKPIYIN